MSYSMRPLGFCDCNAPFYLIKGLIYYSCDRCKAGSPVGNCTICYGSVYLINSKLHRTCDCGTAAVGNITHTIDTITAILDPYALAKAIFPPIALGSPLEPSLPDSTSEMSQPEDSLSQAAHSENDGILLPPSPDHIRKIYSAISLAMTYHASHCTDCDMLSEQSLMCPQWIQMSDSRRFWSKRLPDDERCTA